MWQGGPIRGYTFGIVGAVGSLLCWAIVPVILRELRGYLDPWMANAVRYPLAAMLYWPLLVSAVFSHSLPDRISRRAIIPAVMALGGQVFWSLAYYHLPASVAGFLVRTSFLAGAIGAMVVFADERRLLRRPLFHIGWILAVTGCVVLGMSKLQTDQDVSALGIAIILASALFFGLYAVAVRLYLSDVNPILSFAVVSQYVAAGVLPLAWFGQPSILWELEPRAWTLLAGSSLVGIGAGHVLFYMGVRGLGATITGGVHLASPFVTFAIASAVLRESMTSRELAAGLLLVLGAAAFLASQWTPTRRTS